MPRRGRIVVPCYPHHIVQRGHDRKTVFLTDEDRLAYLATLREFRQEFDLQVYGYCLMTNHVSSDHQPWQGRGKREPADEATGGPAYSSHQSSRTTHGHIMGREIQVQPIESDSYLLACSRYVDLNPVRAHIVEHPEDGFRRDHALEGKLARA
jgi:putative transposase